MFEGLRWFDIKRYGITVHHAYRDPKEDEVHHDELRWDDPRRVLQIPQNVIDAGYPSSNRVKSLDADDGDGMKAVPVLAEPEPKHQDNNNE